MPKLSDRHTVTLTSEIELAELADQITTYVDHDRVLDFIMLIDEMIADYDFSLNLTNKMIKTFDAQFQLVVVDGTDGKVGIEWDEP